MMIISPGSVAGQGYLRNVILTFTGINAKQILGAGKHLCYLPVTFVEDILKEMENKNNKSEWHFLSDREIAERVGTDFERGLDAPAVTERRNRYGSNELTQKKGQGSIVRFLQQFHQPLVYILLAATVVTALLQEWVDSGVIFGVILINSIVGFIQESKALSAVAALARSMTSEATVIRGGMKSRISSVELVPGDVVLLQSGDKVPADLRLIRVRDLQIDESALTGESVPVEKRPGVLSDDTPLADRKNMGYSSTLVTYGTATGVVVETGDRTEIGRISEMLSSVEILATPLTRTIQHFSHFLLYVILGLSALVFVIGRLHGHSWIDTFMASVALAVSAIPEGLPAAVTIMLAVGVSRLAKRRAIIRRLPAVETLGSTTVICSDKTGTLTQNQMTVQQIHADGVQYSVSGAGYSPEGDITGKGSSTPEQNESLRACLTAGLLCNDSILVEEDGAWKVQGDPTEGALLVSARKAGMDSGLQKQYPRLDAIPFESQHQYMATLHDCGPGRPRRVYIKGSVESLIPRCVSELGVSGDQKAIDSDIVYDQTKALAAEGLRVLAFAGKEMSADATTLEHKDLDDGLIFFGLQGMIDPPRPEAASAVAACQGAGIRVKMITGDHAITAAAIAGQIGLKGSREGEPPIALTGRELSELSGEALIDAAENTAVFARVSPEHKLRLVESLQSRGHVVAMTGDGVNDAPALRRADIGVAMALGGTEVAREAADMVLTDDNFATIEAAVEEGRGIFDNLLKFIVWTLPTNGGESLVLIVAILLGIQLPILPGHILWINMTTAVFLGLMLVFEPKEPGIMRRPPRDTHVSLMSRDLLIRIVIVSVLLCGASFAVFEWELARGATDAEARTAVSGVIVFGEIFYLFSCRSLTHSMFTLGLFSNPWIWFGAVSMTLLQLVFTYLPLMNQLFDTAPIPFGAWVGILASGLLVYITIGAEKWIRHRISWGSKQGG
jgi:cation-transporting P-type ATPase F